MNQSLLEDGPIEGFFFFLSFKHKKRITDIELGIKMAMADYEKDYSLEIGLKKLMDGTYWRPTPDGMIRFFNVSKWTVKGYEMIAMGL